MEYLDSFIRLIELIGVGGLVFILTLRWQRKKAIAEAKKAEAEAKSADAEAHGAEASAAKELQDVYQQLINDIKADREEQKSYINELKEDRQHLRKENGELRERIDTTDETVRQLQHDVARTGRMVEFMRPFLCGDTGCKTRQFISINDNGDVRQTKTREKKDNNKAEK
jgi:hypothetical protein